MPADRLAELLSEYAEVYGGGPIVIDSKGGASLPRTGRFTISISRHCAQAGYCVLYSRDVCRVPRDVVERLGTLGALLARTFDNRCGVVYSLAGGMPYGCLPLHLPTTAASDLEDAKTALLTELGPWSETHLEHPPGNHFPVFLAPTTVTYLNACLSHLLGAPTQLEPVTKTMQMETADLDFWLCPSYRGPGYGRIMAILSPPPAGSGEWPLWFLLRRNEVSDFKVGMSNGAIVSFRDLKEGEVAPGQFPAWVARFLAATRQLRDALQHQAFEFGPCLSGGPSTNLARYHLQYWFECVDCRIEKSIGLCLPCAAQCHGTHQLRIQMPASFFCDCPATGCCTRGDPQAGALDFVKLLGDGDHADAALTFGDGVTASYHRVLLARSPYLRQLLTSTPQPCPVDGLGGDGAAACIRLLYGDPNALSHLAEEDRQEMLAALAGPGDGPTMPDLRTWMLSMVDDPAFADVTLTCGEASFYAQRAVLAARSEYWQRLLGSGMSEATSETLLIGDGTAAPAVGLALLRYLYADAVPQEDPGLVLALLCLAKELVLEELAYRCEVLLCRLVEPSVAAELHALCVHHGSHTVAEVCVERMGQAMEAGDDLGPEARSTVYEAWCRSCVALLMKGDFDRTVALGTRAQALCPRHSRAVSLQAVAHLCLGDGVRAAQAIARALAPAMVPHRDTYLYGAIYALAQGLPDHALRLLTAMVTHDDTHTPALEADPAQLPGPPAAEDLPDPPAAEAEAEALPGDAPAPSIALALPPPAALGPPRVDLLEAEADPVTAFLVAAAVGNLDRVGRGLWNCPLLTVCQGLTLERGGRVAQAVASYTLALTLVAPLPFPLARTGHGRLTQRP